MFRLIATYCWHSALKALSITPSSTSMGSEIRYATFVKLVGHKSSVVIVVADTSVWMFLSSTAGLDPYQPVGGVVVADRRMMEPAIVAPQLVPLPVIVCGELTASTVAVPTSYLSRMTARGRRL